MLPQTREMIGTLPYVVRQRIDGYLDYVYDQLLDLLIEADQTALLSQMIGDVEVIFVLRYLHRLFSTGYENYANTLNFFRSRQIRGYQIGSTEYTTTSELTLSWRRLATGISQLSEDPDIRSLVTSQDSIQTTLRRYLSSYWGISL